jgi:SAM-dependent methyltransferase
MGQKRPYDRQAYMEITSCEVCQSNILTPVLDLGMHPMCDDLVPIGNSTVPKEYPIQILFCAKCRTGHQRFQIPKRELFQETYHYRARHTADVLSGMANLVEITDQRLGGLKGRKVLDIGCNDGSLLSAFARHGAKTFGIEPTGAFADAQQAGHTVIHDFLSEEIAHQFVRANGQPDVISFTNVFAHIEDLKAVLRALKILAHPQTAIVIENHYLGSVIERTQFDTFYHEHPRTYSYTSFVHIAQSLGMQIQWVDFPKRYGGNIRVFLKACEAGQNPKHDGFTEATEREASFGADLIKMAHLIANWRTSKRKQIDSAIAKHGKLVGKAFPGRSAISMKLLNLDETHVSAIYEKPQSAKVGHYVPGSRIPILSDDKLTSAIAPGAPILNLAWHISDEIRVYMKNLGFNGEFIDIISPSDFRDAADKN